jgi:hexokinase
VRSLLEAHDGAGTNAAYLEQLAHISKLQAPQLRCTHMIVNSEWGGFKAASLSRLPADEVVDAQSVNPGWQAFEKLISGLYLGRITAQLLLRIDEELQPPLFAADVRAVLARPDGFRTPLVSAVDSDRCVCCSLFALRRLISIARA